MLLKETGVTLETYWILTLETRWKLVYMLVSVEELEEIKQTPATP